MQKSSLKRIHVPLNAVFPLRIPNGLDRAARLGPQVGIGVGPSEIEGDQVINLVLATVGATRKAVFFQNAVGLPSSPVAVLACVPILADGVAVRRTDSARCKGGVGQGAGRRCMRIGRWFSSAACVATLTRAFELVREPVYPASGSNLAQGDAGRSRLRRR
jgi:hypothetical protein